MNLTIRAEDIMTPRRLLLHAQTDEEAYKVANREGFDAVPIIGKDGLFRDFWSQPDAQRIRITRRNRTPYDSAVERLLPALGGHLVQFVYYRSEMVGLVDASDLNKPISCLAWLEPMLTLERAILDTVAERKIDEEHQAKALGVAAASARSRQRKAKGHDLVLPLLEYAQFPSLLFASRNLGITTVSDEEIESLNQVRKRAAHAGGAIIRDRSDCVRLQEALTLARSVASRISRRPRTNRLSRH